MIKREELEIEIQPDLRAGVSWGEAICKVQGLRVSLDEFRTVAMFVFNTISEDRIEARLKEPSWGPTKPKKK